MPKDVNAPPTVLVVDDEPNIRSLVHRSLTRAGYRVLVADCGEAALDICGKQGPIDLLLTDVFMPRISGPDLAKTLEASQPGLKVVYMSAVFRRDVEKHYADFATHPEMELIPKPNLLYELQASVRKALEN